MEKKENSKSYKTIPILVFVALIIKVAYSIYIIANGASVDTTEALIALAGRFIDVVMCFVLAVWFLHIFFYAENAIGRKTMKVATITVVVTAIINLLVKMISSLYFTNSVEWILGYSGAELLVVIIISVYLLKIYSSYRKEQKQLHHRKKHRSDATLLDALLGRI